MKRQVASLAMILSAVHFLACGQSGQRNQWPDGADVDTATSKRDAADGGDGAAGKSDTGVDQTSTVDKPPVVGLLYYVSPTGSDLNDGRTEASAFNTIRKGLTVAQPGDVINLTPGTYVGDLSSVRSGTAEAPITIQGPATAIVKGVKNTRLFNITHSYLTLDGFTMDGLRGDPTLATGYSESLIYVSSAEPNVGQTGLKFLRLTLKNAGRVCVRMRYLVRKTEIGFSTLSNCGVVDYALAGGGEAGEGIYLGTPTSQLADGRNPTADPDASTENWFHDNVMDTQGSDCFEIREAADANIIEKNKCTGQTNSPAVNVRGNNNVIRSNEIYGGNTAGIRLGSDIEGVGVNNEAYDNYIHDTTKGAFHVFQYPQGKICGNRLTENNVPPESRGPYGDVFTPSAPCP